MNPAGGSGSAQFRGGPGASDDRAALPVAGHDPTEPREPGVTMQNVQSLLDRAQRLVDTRPPGPYPVAWCVNAEQFGDPEAIGALAVLAARHA